MRVVTYVETASWQLVSDTDDPETNPARALVGPLRASWAIDVLPPQPQPSSLTIGVYDDGTNPSGWIPLDVGDPIGVYVVTENIDGSWDGPITFQGRIGEVSGTNAKRGGVLFQLVCVDRLADLTSSPAPRVVRGVATTSSVPFGVHPLFRAYNQIANHADIDLTYTAEGGWPFWSDARDAEVDASTLEALGVYTAHDVRSGVHHYLSYDIDSADPTPPTSLTYELVPYDPAGVDDLAGVLELIWDGSAYILADNVDYYDDHSGLVLDASNLAFDVGDWRKARGAQLNTVELAGKFRSNDFPTQVGIFRGNSGLANSATASPNVDPLPATIEDGDWAWCVITGATGSDTTITPPDGWIQHPTSPLVQASTVTSWLFTKELSADDAGTVPLFAVTAAAVTIGWILTGAVVTDTDGIDGPNAANPATSTLPVPSSGSTTINFPSTTPEGKNRLAYALAATRMGTGAADNLAFVNGWTVEDSSQNAMAASRMGHYLIRKPLATANPSGAGTGIMSTTGVNNGVAWAFTFKPSGSTESVRAEWSDLVSGYGRNTRALDSFLYWRDDAEDLASELLGDRSQVQTGYGLTEATIVWETLSTDQLAAWSNLLWPNADTDALGKPMAIVGIPSSWRLVDGPAVFGRLMGLEAIVDADRVRVKLQLRAVPAMTSSGISYTGMGTHVFPDVTYANIDPTITYDQLTLVED